MLTSGTQLGPYQVLESLGAGGMGEVYRARDTRLDRVVAIKILSSDIAASPDARQRFEREARAISSLNHPNICTLYDVGHQDGIEYIVMEYIEGETLTSRLKNGPLPKNDLLRYSIQIADALDKAHRQGIVHRDLKPGNIILTRSGAKLLDFGLVKLRSDVKKGAEVSSLPTEHRELTREGMVMGTFQYMSPEQLEGKDVDARTDIFAFGAVLYEMATGKKAFHGNSQASLIAAILKEEPAPVSELQPLTPPILERLIKTCLAKDPEDRWQSAHDIGNELRWIAESSQATASITPHKSHRRWINATHVGWIVAAALALILLLNFMVGTRKAENESIEARFSIPTPYAGSMLFTRFAADPDFAVSHDGSKLVFLVRDPGGKYQLWLRSLNSSNSQPISGTEEGRLPFWSPDGQQIGYWSEARLKRVPVSGGSPQTICDIGGEFRGAAWHPDGTILFATSESGLMLVSADGGNPKPLTELNPEIYEQSHSWPVFLPDNKNFLYLSDTRDPATRAIYLGSLKSKEVKQIMKTPLMAKYINPGYLLFISGDHLVAQRLELDPPQLTGDPIRISEIRMNVVRGIAPFSVSANGVIAYGNFGISYKTQLEWFDRNGKKLETVGPVGADVTVNLSSDARYAVVSSMSELGRAVGRAEIPVNVWVLDLIRGVRTRITFDPAVSDENPVWSQDGRTLFFASHPNAGEAQVFRKASSGEGQSEPILIGNGNEHPIDISPDGKFLLLHAAGIRAGLDLMILPLDKPDAKPEPFVATPFEDAQGQFSPDGRWIAYTSTESGREEVYVKPFPVDRGKWQISSTGGSDPRWRNDGKELFYIAADGTMMSVKIELDGGFSAAPPVALFRTSLGEVDLNHYGGAHRYDVTPDGSRFLISSIVSAATPNTLNVIVNWKPPRH